MDRQLASTHQPLFRAAPRAPRNSLALGIIAVILSVAALHWGREFFIPIAMALTFHAVFRPVVRKLERLRVPTPVAAGIVVLAGLGLAVAAGWALSGPVSRWLDRAPESVRAVRGKFHSVGRPLDRLTEAATTVVTPVPAPAPRVAPVPPPATTQATGSLFTRLLAKATSLVTHLVEVTVLLYLMLAGGTLFLRKVIDVLPRSSDKRTASDVLHRTESIVATYLVLTAIMNVAQAVLVGLALWAIGVPDPLIWALLTFVLEFIPYLGGATMVILLSIAGFTTFPDVGHALLAPAIYLTITTIQNTLLVPYIFGDRLKLNPLSVVVCVLFWWFVWGIPGVFLAIPIAATLKALGDQIPRLAPLGEFLGE